MLVFAFNHQISYIFQGFKKISGLNCPWSQRHCTLPVSVQVSVCCVVLEGLITKSGKSQNLPPHQSSTLRLAHTSTCALQTLNIACTYWCISVPNVYVFVRHLIFLHLDGLTSHSHPYFFINKHKLLHGEVVGPLVRMAQRNPARPAMPTSRRPTMA
jgi:hypothetical protein